MTVRHVLSLADLSMTDLARLTDLALTMASGRADRPLPLDRRLVGIYFRRSSTRTRTAFTAGALRLGAQTITYGPNDLQVVTNETIYDTARVLANYLDALVIRTNESMAEMRAWAAQDQMAIINGLTENEHPTQALADLVTIKEAFGHLDGIHVLFIGEGNSTAASLAQAVSLTPGMRLTLVTPPGYGLAGNILEHTQVLGNKLGASIAQHHRMDDLPREVDVVYTTRWLTMGVQKSDANWQSKFEPYRVSAAVMAKVSKRSGTIFLHDLPAMRGFEVTDEVLDGPQSRAFRQAWHKQTSAMAVLSWCLCAE